MQDQAVQRTGTNRFAPRPIESHRWLAPGADLWSSLGDRERMKKSKLYRPFRGMALRKAPNTCIVFCQSNNPLIIIELTLTLTFVLSAGFASSPRPSPGLRPPSPVPTGEGHGERISPWHRFNSRWLVGPLQRSSFRRNQGLMPLRRS